MVAQPGQDRCGRVPSPASWSAAACLARALAGFLQRFRPFLGPVECLLLLLSLSLDSWLLRWISNVVSARGPAGTTT
jgi:hypothetical protein